MASSLSKESQGNTSAGDKKVHSKLMFAEYAISLEPVVKGKYREKMSVIGIDHFSFRCRNISENVCLKLKPVIIYHLTSFLTQATAQIRSLTLFRLGSFGTITLGGGHIVPLCFSFICDPITTERGMMVLSLVLWDKIPQKP